MLLEQRGGSRSHDDLPLGSTYTPCPGMRRQKKRLRWYCETHYGLREAGELRCKPIVKVKGKWTYLYRAIDNRKAMTIDLPYSLFHSQY